MRAVALVVALGLALVVFVPTATTSCATQETKFQVDAGQKPCNVGPAIFCEVAPADGPACNTDDQSSPLLLQLPRATRYKQGCVINFVGNRDPQGDCIREGGCSCIFADPALNQPPASDGGTSSDDAGDAAVPPPPPPTGDQSVVWQCFTQ